MNKTVYWAGIERGLREMQAQVLMAIQCVDHPGKDECWKIINKIEIADVVARMSK